MNLQQASRGGFVIGLFFSADVVALVALCRSIDWASRIPPEQTGLFIGYFTGLAALVGALLFLGAMAMIGPDKPK